MTWWSSVDIVERIGTVFNWIVAIAGIGAVVFAGRASTLRASIERTRTSESEALKRDLAAAYALAAPARLVTPQYQVGANATGQLVATIQFTPSKNEVLGLLEFAVTLHGPPEARIQKIWPSLHGGAFSSSDQSAQIVEDGRSATLQYALIGPGRPTLDVTVSAPCLLQIDGNHLDACVTVPVQVTV